MSGPIATRHDDGSVTLEWPDGKPGVFDMSTVTFERMIEDANAERALCDDLMAWIETARPGGTKAQLNVQSDALDALKARYQEMRQR